MRFLKFEPPHSYFIDMIYANTRKVEIHNLCQKNTESISGMLVEDEFNPEAWHIRRLYITHNIIVYYTH